jgi:hypothetical protein
MVNLLRVFLLNNLPEKGEKLPLLKKKDVFKKK